MKTLAIPLMHSAWSGGPLNFVLTVKCLIIVWSNPNKFGSFWRPDRQPEQILTWDKYLLQSKHFWWYFWKFIIKAQFLKICIWPCHLCIFKGPVLPNFKQSCIFSRPVKPVKLLKSKLIAYVKKVLLKFEQSYTCLLNTQIQIGYIFLMITPESNWLISITTH